MKHILFSIILLIPFIGISQNKNIELNKANNYLKARNEVYFKFSSNNISSLKEVNKLISVDKINNDSIYAYANTKQFLNFLKEDIRFTTLKPPSLVNEIKTCNSLRDFQNWDTYPSYDVYIATMNQFAADYPDLCKVKDIGFSTNGRQILSVKISDNVNIKEPEPEFFYTSTMHGDELTGMILCLHLIDYLLSSYGTDNRITNLVNNVEIYINPLSNPDGTYYAGNNTVQGSIRFNANGIDLNRNFPDPENGLHPDGNPWQQETLVMMDFMMNHNFVLAANMHTGSEVINYPWDTWSTLHADNDWYFSLSYQYADSVHIYSPASLGSYLTSLNNGITNGYEWYSTNGNRQDFMNYFMHGREVTMELSNTKIPPASTLPLYWDANVHSLISYIEECNYGVSGIITDSISNEPLLAKVTVLNHDFDESFVFSNIQHGNYSRMLLPETYNLLFSAPGYEDKIINDVVVNSKSLTELDVKLLPVNQDIYIEANNSFEVKVFPNPFINVFTISFQLAKVKNLSFTITNDKGEPVRTITKRFFFSGINEFEVDLSGEASGIYFISSKDKSFTTKLIKL